MNWSFWRSVATLGVAALLLCGAARANAQLMIGQSSGFTGPVATGVKENTQGALAYFTAVNAAGGVHGKRIELLTLDDRFDPATSRRNAEILIKEHRVLALFLNRGADNVAAVLPLLEEHRVPMVAPTSGAMNLHRPVHPWVFHVRSPYQSEIARAVMHLNGVGVHRIAVLHSSDSFGRDCAEGAAVGFRAAGLEPVLSLSFDRQQADFTAAAADLVRKEAQAVLLLGASASVAAATAAIRKAGSNAQIVTQSTNASSGFIKAMGPYARGTIVTQGFPSERAQTFPLAREARALGEQLGIREFTPSMMEGFVGAKVLVEALRRAGPSPTPAGLKAALEGMSSYDIGGLKVSFSPTNHTGMDYADISIIDAEGKFRR